MFNRRRFLHAASATLLGSLIKTRTGFASVDTDKRFVLVFLRGGLDSLHAMAPYADKHYQKLRPTLALGDGQSDRPSIDIDGYFGLHPALEPLRTLYRQKELVFIPAASTRYRNRSHFDGQNMLENGSGRPYGARDGWLNRAIAGMTDNDRRLGLALGPSVPLILQGDAGVQTWSDSKLPEVDDDFLRRLGLVYASDRLFADALQDASDALQPDASMMNTDQTKTTGNRRNRDFALSARAAADLLSRADGPRIAAMELQGWDTHFGQQWRLNGLFQTLASGITELKAGLAEAWSKTAVLVVSEFGRTAAENGNRGTDHGTGGMAILAGGAVSGGKIVGDWPGLSNRSLYEQRDLLAVNGYEDIFKSVLADHLGLAERYIDSSVLPGNPASLSFEGLFS